MVKFAVLGCGRIGRMHAANLARHPRAELAWVFDVAPGAAASVAEATGARQAREVDEIEQVVITSRDPGPPPVSYIEVSGGLFRDMTIHDFDMARYLMGEIVSVYATGANLIEPAIKTAGDIDAAMIILESADGALCHINNSRRCAYGYDQRVETFGEQGMLQAANQRPTSVQAWGARGTEAKDPVLDFFIERYTPAYLAEIGHFVDCVEKGTPPLASYRDGREALRLADAALESMTTGRTVRLD